MCGVMCAQATVHRIWIADEGYYERKDANFEAGNITTIRREMEALGAPWLNILKMVSPLRIQCLATPTTCTHDCGTRIRLIVT